MSKHATNITINADALRHNLAVVKQLAPNSKIMAMVKANAYGHGLLKIANIFSNENIDLFGVFCCKEALKLRQNGINKPISIMHGFYNTEELIKTSELSCQSVIYENWQLKALTEIKLPKPHCCV
jgi:alanine racemase